MGRMTINHSSFMSVAQVLQVVGQELDGFDIFFKPWWGHSFHDILRMRSPAPPKVQVVDPKEDPQAAGLPATGGLWNWTGSHSRIGLAPIDLSEHLGKKIQHLMVDDVFHSFSS